MKKKNAAEKKKRAWLVGTALALAAIAILLVTFYSGTLSLTAYHDNRPITQAKITTKIDCSFSNGTVRAVISTPGMTVSASQLNDLNVVWSTANPMGYVRPTVSRTQDGGVAQASYVSRGSEGANNTVRADFLGGWSRAGFGWMQMGSLRYYTPSSCTVPVSVTKIVDPTPRPTVSPTPTFISDPTPRPTICPHVCRLVNGRLQCGCTN